MGTEPSSPRVPFRRVGNRISQLPLAQFCGLSSTLSDAHGAGRAAAKSKAFHARCAGEPEAKALFAALTEKERAELALWKEPTTIKVGPVELDYASSEKELFVGLSASGEPVNPRKVETLTCGTIDFAWVREVQGRRTAYVADIKKSRWTVEGPTTLQLLAYGWAYAKARGCSTFAPGLWIAEDGEWDWHDKFISVDGFDGLDLWETISAAASNRGQEATTGPHCANCYSRLFCPEYAYPLAAAVPGFAPTLSDDATPEELGAAILLAQRLGEAAAAVLENAKERVRRGALATDEKGRVFRSIQIKGRESLNLPLLLEAHPDATKFFRRGDAFSQFRWLKGAK